MSNSNRHVPVIMYHSIREVRNPRWVYSHLTMKLSFFIQQLEYYKRANYYIATLDEVLAFKRGELCLPEKTISLTFDDGYLDNWVYAFPLLMRYGFRATIFVSPEFIQQEQNVRPSLEDVWAGRYRLSELIADGFMTWKELEHLQASGLVDIQSHSMTHTYYPISDEIVDFHHPGDEYIWLQWNTRPNQKPFYMGEGYIDPVPLGTPVYKSDTAIVAKRVYVDEKISQYLAEYVGFQGGGDFFNRSNWKDELFRISANYKLEHPTVYQCETEAEYANRLTYELQESRQTIERQLGKSVTILCWPNGGWNERTHNLALKLGYEATTAKGSPNIYKSPDPSRILRTGLHQVGESRIISRIFNYYALNAHSNVWPYAQIRRSMASLGATPILKKIFYRV